MKNLKKWFGLLLTVVTISTSVTMPVMAAETDTTLMPTDLSMVKLRLEERGVDPSNGELISEYWGREEDNTPYVERVYLVNDIMSTHETGTISYKKVKDYGATGYVEVIGTFKYNTTAQTVNVTKVTGGLYDEASISGKRNEKKYAKNDGSKEASAVYSIECNRNLGGWTTYSVSVSCNYNGK